MRAAMISLALLAGFIVPLDEAAGQSNCQSRCKGNSACLNRCANLPKRPAAAKQGQTASKPAVSPSGGPSGWRDRAFTTEGGAGGY
jgi:hypothetical protein